MKVTCWLQITWTVKVSLYRNTIILTSCINFYDPIFQDVNECDTANGGCNQTCANTVGSFECSCGDGLILAADNLDCDGKKQ